MAEEYDAIPAILQIQPMPGGFWMEYENGDAAFIPSGLISRCFQLAGLFETRLDAGEVVFELVCDDDWLGAALLYDLVQCLKFRVVH